MKTLAITFCALAVSSLALAQMTTSADARSRYSKRGLGTPSMSNNTGGRSGRDSSAAGGNSSQPSRRSGGGSAGGGSGGNGGL
ncbi:hypothetical protein IPV08_16555 [Methylobacterium sp. SD274]|uniref:hypothetical protein n=1 Tax=unclassified Methylobacterium TaxID=2615210 RepID=UPI0006F423AF|nr:MULTISPECIES: hypothetical protein [unclassified Methylobacterium]MBO1021574.1 hypothetical protein [Methylobacterium sp. SD274]